jgi:RNA polymerase sigma-70 factor (ECF subfamily)
VTPDQELQAAAAMGRAQRGDQAAYDEVLRLAARAARGFVIRRVGAVDWAEDVVQEALITIHKARHTYDPARAFGPWFYAIVNSRLIDALRRTRRVGAREVVDEAVLAAQPAPRPAGADGDIRETLARAVAGLPRVQREIVSLLKYEDLSVRDVARRMGMSEAAVKASAHRGYKLLRRTVGLADVEHRPAD